MIKENNKNDAYLTTKIEEIKLKIRDYLMYLGAVEVRPEHGKWRCPNSSSHRNGDENPSMSFVPGTDDIIIKCFACGLQGDIFKIAHELENLPRDGYEFLTTTIPILAKIVGVKFDLENIVKDEDLEETFRIRRMCEIVESHLDKSKAVDLMVAKRHYTKEYAETIADKYKIGVANKTAVEKDLLNEFSIDEIKDSGLIPFDMNDNTLILSLKDSVDKTVAFAARNYNDNVGPKWVNSKNNILYNKSKYLYLMDYERKREVIKSKKIYLAEGYFDVIGLSEIGITNTGGISSASLSEENFRMLKKLNIDEISMILDNDAGGIKGLSAIVKNNIIRERDYDIEFKTLILPNDLDPDEWIIEMKKKGYSPSNIKERFASTDNELEDVIEEVDLLEWYIKKTITDNRNDKTVLQRTVIELCKIVSNFTLSSIRQRMYAKLIHDLIKDSMVSVETDHIYEEIINRSSFLHEDVEKEYQNIITKATKLLNKTPDPKEAMRIMDEAIEGVVEIIKRKNMMQRSIEAEKDVIRQIRNSNDQSERLYTGIKAIDDYIKFRKHPKVMMLAGYPSQGKSTFLRHLALNMLIRAKESIENDECKRDIFILFLSIDDNNEQTINPILSNMSGVQEDIIASPPDTLQPEIRNRMDKAIDKLESWTGENIVFKDVTYGSSLDYLEKEISYLSKIHDDKWIFVIVDNFHNLEDLESTEKRAAAESALSRINRISKRYNCDMFLSVELTKATYHGFRPTPNKIKETGSAYYKAFAIFMIHNDSFYNEESVLKWDKDEFNTNLPIIELNLAKIKKGAKPNHVFFFKMDPSKGRFHDVDDNLARELFKETQKDRIKQMYS